MLARAPIFRELRFSPDRALALKLQIKQLFIITNLSLEKTGIVV